MLKTLFFTISFAFVYIDLTASGINFLDINIESAQSLATKENKLIFISTYASWCAPCKKMDDTFLISNVASFYNDHFISVQVDMEEEKAYRFASEYNIVFLPTLLILDPSGNILSKIESPISAEQLIEVGQESLRGTRTQNYMGSLASTPFSNKQNAVTDYNPEDKEEVIYVYDPRASSARPRIMYHEAYLHLQLMDGKHQRVVKKYLSTQDDWTTEENVRFIFDFLQDVNSDLFKFVIENKHRFYDVMGRQKVDHTISILIDQRLHQGFPGSEMEEIVRLFTYLDATNAQKLADRYFYKRSLNQKVE